MKWIQTTFLGKELEKSGGYPIYWVEFNDEQILRIEFESDKSKWSIQVLNTNHYTLEEPIQNVNAVKYFAENKFKEILFLIGNSTGVFDELKEHLTIIKDKIEAIRGKDVGIGPISFMSKISLTILNNGTI